MHIPRHGRRTGQQQVCVLADRSGDGATTRGEFVGGKIATEPHVATTDIHKSTVTYLNDLRRHIIYVRWHGTIP